MDTPSVAYLAGFIDGEGSIQIASGTWQKYARGYTLHLAAKQVDPRPLDALAARFGGRVFRDVPRQPNRLAHYRWGIVGRQAERALRTLLPYLIVKREQAELALRSRELPRATGANSKYRLDEWDYAERDSFAQALRESKHVEYEAA